MININVELDNKEFIYEDLTKTMKTMNTIIDTFYTRGEFTEGQGYILGQIRESLEEKIAEIAAEANRNFPHGLPKPNDMNFDVEVWRNLQPKGSYYNPIKITRAEIDNGGFQ